MNKKLLSLYSLKFNPFSPEVPTSALCSTPAIESFCWRIEQQIGEGGFALAIGDPGTGKSAALRILVERLGNLRDVVVGALSRPQASLADFYRELGHLFSVPLIDEAQQMSSSALSELRFLSSVELDSRSILTTVLAGDHRVASRLEEPELLPIASRIRARLRTEALAPSELLHCLNHLLKTAGNTKLMNPSLLQTLCEHAAGNLRLLMNMANDLLAAAVHQEREQIDEKLFFEVFSLDPKPPKRS